MTDATPGGETVAPALTRDACARCEKTLTEGDRFDADDRSFCLSCYEALRAELAQVADSLSKDVDYTRAALGALLGGALGVLLWWGFTVVTKIGFGLIAVAIGFLVARGAMLFSGEKRSGGLQFLSIGVAVVSFFVASYLVNMTFINQYLASQSDERRIPFPPTDAGQFVDVVSSGFGIMDVVFLAIVVWQAWSMPRPLRLPDASPAATS